MNRNERILRNRREAQAAYKLRLANVRELLREIGEIVEADAEERANNPDQTNWEHVGSLAHVDEQLEYIHTFLTNDE